ncbi:MAG: META domain-containing protein [Rikenella sp.]|nr:META domain-containing protein [Rikenella sp.]
MIRFATAIFLSAALFTTCRNVGRSPLVLESDIWVAIDSDSVRISDPAGSDSARPSLEFFSDGQLTGYTSCNSFFGNYTTWKADSIARIDITIEGITMALCPDNLIEHEYVDRLDRAFSYTVRDRRLSLRDSTGATLLLFVPASETHKSHR